MEVEVEIHPQPDGECSPENKKSKATDSGATQLLQEGDSGKAESQEIQEHKETGRAITKEGKNVAINMTLYLRTN